MAMPWPVSAPPDCLILESALWPQITPGMALKMEKQVRLRMPNTRLQIASAEFFGWGALPGSGGMVSFIDSIGFVGLGTPGLTITLTRSGISMIFAAFY